MNGRITNDFEHLDHKTCQAICDAVGERLQERLRPEPALPPHLQHLMEELRRRDDRLH